MAEQFTPGPWALEVVKPGEYGVRVNGDNVSGYAAFVRFDWPHQEQCSEQIANAHLIAAAPALYEAAGMALDLPELIAERNASFDEPNGVSAQNEIDAALAAIRAALAKADKPAGFSEWLREAVERATYKAGLTRAVLDNVREEIRDEVGYALTLALAGARHPVASDGEAVLLRPNQGRKPEAFQSTTDQGEDGR